MRARPLRLFAAAFTLLCFLVLWNAIAARPWVTTAKQPADPRLRALTLREHELRRESTEVKRLVARRWARYERRLAARRREIAASRRRHELELAAARLAAQRLAAAAAAHSAVVVSSVAPPASAPATGSAPGPAPAPRVVTLPPQVQTVALPPVTSTGSSH